MTSLAAVGINLGCKRTQECLGHDRTRPLRTPFRHGCRTPRVIASRTHMPLTACASGPCRAALAATRGSQFGKGSLQVSGPDRDEVSRLRFRAATHDSGLSRASPALSSRFRTNHPLPSSSMICLRTTSWKVCDNASRASSSRTLRDRSAKTRTWTVARACCNRRPVRRRAGPMPLVLRISRCRQRRDLDSQAGRLAVHPAVAPAWVLPGHPADQGLDGPAGRRAAGRAAHGPRGPAAPDDVAVPAQDRVRGDQQPRSVAAGFRYHAGQRREQGPVRPVQLRAARLPPLQDGELAAQDQDLCGLPCLLAPGQPQPPGYPRGGGTRTAGT